MTALVENPDLGKFFKVLSLSLDKSGAAYISTLEGRKYPFTATQWHPEKNAYEWTPHLHIPHTTDAVRALQPPSPLPLATLPRTPLPLPSPCTRAGPPVPRLTVALDCRALSLPAPRRFTWPASVWVGLVFTTFPFPPCVSPKSINRSA